MDTNAPGLHLLLEETHLRDCATGESGWVTDRWGPPVGFISLLPRALGQRQGRASPAITGATGHRFRCPAYPRDQEDGPHRKEGQGEPGELLVERSFDNGGGRLRVGLGIQSMGSIRRNRLGVRSCGVEGRCMVERERREMLWLA